MLKTIDKIKFKTDKIADLLEDVKKPMNLNEIMSKHGVSYPFTVKCVKEFYRAGTGEPSNSIGKVHTMFGDSPEDISYAESEEAFHNKSSKKFILWE